MLRDFAAILRAYRVEYRPCLGPEEQALLAERAPPCDGSELLQRAIQQSSGLGLLQDTEEYRACH